MNYPLKLLIDRDLDNLFIDSVKEYKKQDGKFCNKCQIIQGKPNIGWSKYYCKCLEKSMSKKFSKRNIKLLKEIIKCTLDKQGIKNV